MGTGSKKKTGAGGDHQKPLLWRLPEVASTELGKIGPAFGLGIGCGAGAGVGFFGGAGLGYGFPGLTLGFGVGAGCGVGFGFGYGLGKGIAYDENKRYSNVGKMFQEAPSLPVDTVAGLVDELVVNTKKFVRATSKEIEKWR
uniref:Glycine-rich protein n=1 Tax=Leersia perrieri TaxID=77586 RepID=A0A0D9XQQ8_9ORYZ